MNKLTSILTVSLVSMMVFNSNGFTKKFINDVSQANHDIFGSYVLLPQSKDTLNNTNYKGQQSINSTDEDLEEDDGDLWTAYVDVSTSKQSKEISNDINNEDDDFKILNINEEKEKLNLVNNEKANDDINLSLLSLSEDNNNDKNNAVNNTNNSIKENILNEWCDLGDEADQYLNLYSVDEMQIKTLKKNFGKTYSNVPNKLKECYDAFQTLSNTIDNTNPQWLTNEWKILKNGDIANILENIRTVNENFDNKLLSKNIQLYKDFQKLILSELEAVRGEIDSIINSQELYNVQQILKNREEVNNRLSFYVKHDISKSLDCYQTEALLNMYNKQKAITKKTFNQPKALVERGNKAINSLKKLYNELCDSIKQIKNKCL